MKRKTVCYLIKIDRVSTVTDGEHNDKVVYIESVDTIVTIFSFVLTCIIMAS